MFSLGKIREMLRCAHNGIKYKAHVSVLKI
jgi:hypothetical protein